MNSKVEFQLTDQNRQQIKIWENANYRDTALALFGTRTENLVTVLQTDLLRSQAPNENMVPYQLELVKDGSMIYYAHPLIDNIMGVRTSKARKLARSIIDPIDGQTEYELNFDRLRHSAESYALEGHMEVHFMKATGVKLSKDEIFALGSIVMPGLVKTTLSNFPGIEYMAGLGYQLDTIDMETSPETLRFENSKLTMEELGDILRDCFQKRGVLIYLNQKILEYQVLPGFEAEDEIMILSKTSLTSDHICGVEILSEFDRADLGMEPH